MKRHERDIAIKLRKEGRSLGEIVTILGVSKASVSVWVRDVELTKTQREGLSARGRSIDSIEKRRTSRITATRQKRRAIMDEAKKDISDLSQYELLLIGTALYWGEGGKTERGMARVSNSDPGVVRIMMRFFREVCGVREERFRGAVHTFSHLNALEAEEYWSQISGIPLTQFYKTYSKPSIASKGKMDKLPFGTFQIYVCDTILFYQILGRIERLAELGDRNMATTKI